jgi:uncharacterized protein involved in copper resistance
VLDPAGGIAGTYSPLWQEPDWLQRSQTCASIPPVVHFTIRHTKKAPHDCKNISPSSHRASLSNLFIIEINAARAGDAACRHQPAQSRTAADSRRPAQRGKSTSHPDDVQAALVQVQQLMARSGNSGTQRAYSSAPQLGSRIRAGVLHAAQEPLPVAVCVPALEGRPHP